MVRLGPQCPTDVKEKASQATWDFSFISDDNRVKIAAAGAILPLLALLGPQNTVEVQKNAAGTLWNLALNVENQAIIRSAWGVAALNQLIQTTTNAAVRSTANGALDAVNA